MVRVIGRVDLADEVHRTLAAVGIESYVVTAGPMQAVNTTGEDASEADVVHDLGMCESIKRKARHRPVVMITTTKDERRVLALMRGALGPDTHVLWPARGEDLRDAIARAVSVAKAVRPRFPGARLPGLVTLTLGMVLLLVQMVRDIAGADRNLYLFQIAGGSLLGTGLLLGARYSPTRRWDLTFGAFMLSLAAIQLVLHVVL